MHNEVRFTVNSIKLTQFNGNTPGSELLSFGLPGNGKNAIARGGYAVG